MHAYHTPLLHFLNTLRYKSSVSMLILGVIVEVRNNCGYTWRIIMVISDLLEINDIEGSRRVVSMRNGLSLSEVI